MQIGGAAIRAATQRFLSGKAGDLRVVIMVAQVGQHQDLGGAIIVPRPSLASATGIAAACRRVPQWSRGRRPEGHDHTMTTRHKIRFYSDYKSPYAYLAKDLVYRLEAETWLSEGRIFAMRPQADPEQINQCLRNCIAIAERLEHKPLVARAEAFLVKVSGESVQR